MKNIWTMSKMQVEERKIKVRDIIQGYQNDEENGVVAYGGNLNVRPKYQREFIYKPDQQVAVINTVFNGFPLNTMYWVDNEDGTYEVLDGQQRTLSICSFAIGGFSYNGLYIHNIKTTYPEMYERFMDYELCVFVCRGTKEEQLEWFRVVNTYGEKLNDQELRNVSFTGPWLTSAKKFFSKTNCPAAQIAEGYVDGSPIRQDILEEVLIWVSGSKNNITEYMAQHQHDENAKHLVEYFTDVINWVKETFPNYRKEMKGIAWGLLYNEYGEEDLDPDELEEIIHRLMMDEEVTKRKGIYEYVLSGDERKLSVRSFPEAIKRRKYEQQKGYCPVCGKHYAYGSMQADHIIPWSKGGKTVEDNCQLLCRRCNTDKSSGI